MSGNIGPLSGEFVSLFEEGVDKVLARWTALCLAVDNQWGGKDSREKAQQIWEDIINWFDVTKSPDPQALEDQLEAALLEDFNVQIEDGSTAEVSKTLVHLFEELCHGGLSLIQTLRNTQQSGVSHSQEVGEEEESSSSEDDGSEMEEDMEESPNISEPMDSKEPAPPLVDADGFTVVQGRRKPKS